MLENVGRIRWLAAYEDQLARGKVRKSRVQREAAAWDDGGEQAIREFATYGSADLGDLFDRTEPIKTRGQRAQQRRWNGERQWRADGNIPLTSILESPRFEQ